MTTLLYTHPIFLEHDTGAWHVERPDRLRAVLAVLEAPEFAALERREPPPASLDQVSLVHPRDYVDAVLAAIPERGLVALDPDTIVSPRSGEAALRAAGAACAAVDAVVAGEADNAFCAARPPGHHAEPDRAMGFCLFNNAAIAAAHALAAHGLERVAIVDFDVHHGNGTQAAAEREPRLFYASTHQMPLYPGTGSAEETGQGNVLNVPLAPDSGSREFRAAYERAVFPAVEAFRPELLLVSAGFDAHVADPLASLRLGVEDYVWISERLLGLARRCCSGRLVSTLEGGYDLDALAASAAAHVRCLVGAAAVARPVAAG